jgi:hypothetical protein
MYFIGFLLNLVCVFIFCLFGSLLLILFFSLIIVTHIKLFAEIILKFLLFFYEFKLNMFLDSFLTAFILAFLCVFKSAFYAINVIIFFGTDILLCLVFFILFLILVNLLHFSVLIAFIYDYIVNLLSL